MKINDIVERLANLEARQSLLIDALLGVLKKARQNQSSFAIYALVAGFTAAEIEDVERFFRWATEAADQKDVSRREIVKAFQRRFPRRKDSLVSIAKGYKLEGKFPHICDFILGRNSTNSTRKPKGITP